MFGSKKKETKTSGNSGVSPGSHSLNTLVHGTVVEGAIKADSDIRIDGVIKGSLNCNAKVIIGPTGHIEGEIRCVNAVIEGRFDGNLQVAELLNIREKAIVNGDVKTNQLIVQSGAVFNVTCTMGNQKARSGNFESSIKGSKAVASNGKNKQQESRKQANQILKYSGMGMQMAISVFVGAMIGKRLDAHFQTEMPVWTAALALLFLCTSMYVILKDLLRKK